MAKGDKTTEQNKITVSDFCSIKGVDDLNRLTAIKIYSNQTKTTEEWIQELEGKITFTA